MDIVSENAVAAKVLFKRDHLSLRLTQPPPRLIRTVNHTTTATTKTCLQTLPLLLVRILAWCSLHAILTRNFSCPDRLRRRTQQPPPGTINRKFDQVFSICDGQGGPR